MIMINLFTHTYREIQQKSICIDSI